MWLRWLRPNLEISLYSSCSIIHTAAPLDRLLFETERGYRCKVACGPARIAAWELPPMMGKSWSPTGSKYVSDRELMSYKLSKMPNQGMFMTSCDVSCAVEIRQRNKVGFPHFSGCTQSDFLDPGRPYVMPVSEQWQGESLVRAFQNLLQKLQISATPFAV